MITVAYITARRCNLIEYFFDSLAKQLHEHGDRINLIVVDHFAEEDGRRDEIGVRLLRSGLPIANFVHSEPKPCVWSGKHRLTKVDWFSASNSRNTALCHCRTDYIAFADDLSVLMPDWYAKAKSAQQENTITCGAYRKVRQLQVERGQVMSIDELWRDGMDSRWSYGGEQQLVPCNGDILYGCSFVAPVEAMLLVGGFPEICNGLGFEDVIMGMALQNNGNRFLYNKRMMTYESDEHHSIEPAFRRESFEKHPNDPTDKAHSVLNMMKAGVKYFENYYEGGMKKMRDEVLLGKPFPIINNPQHCWHTGIALSEL